MSLLVLDPSGDRLRRRLLLAQPKQTPRLASEARTIGDRSATAAGYPPHTPLRACVAPQIACAAAITGPDEAVSPTHSTHVPSRQ